MSKFNSTKVKSTVKTVNKAGGQAYSLSVKQKLVTLVLSSFLKDVNYSTGNEQLKELKELCECVEPRFLAKLALYARNEGNMRSVSHVLAGEVAKRVKGETWTKEFFNKVVSRVDDMNEILSYYFSDKIKDKKHQPIPNAMLKGFKKAFNKFSEYQLAKYKSENKSVKLIDLVNLIKPKSSEKNGTILVSLEDWKKTKSKKEVVLKNNMVELDSITALVYGFLKSHDTWESELSKVGQEVSQLDLNTFEKEKLLKEKKAKVWENLIESKKIGYFALLRNLRNIIQQAPDIIPSACKLLIDQELIEKSKVLPFRFLTAFDEIEKIEDVSSTIRTQINVALNKALDLSLKNVPVFEGKTLIVVDVSGSMQGKPSNIASIFASVMYKSNYENSDVMLFDTRSKMLTLNPLDSTTTLINSFRYNGGGTDFKCIFTNLNTAYNRIIILSDMQGWVSYDTPVEKFNKYKQRTKCNPFVYSFDLAGHGTSQFPKNNIGLFSGFSDKVLDVMSNLEVDKNALINTIEAIEI